MCIKPPIKLEYNLWGIVSEVLYANYKIAINFIFVWDTYGIDWEGAVPVDSDEKVVTVEDIPDILNSSQKEQLKAFLSPVSNSDYS